MLFHKLSVSPFVNIIANIHLKARNIEIAKDDIAVFIGRKSRQIWIPNLMRNLMR